MKLKKLFTDNFELIFWVSAMIALAFSDPAKPHFTLCPLKLMGITWCPGCGLGHSISYLFRGEFRSSFHAHWLGVPALIIIFYRMLVLFWQTAIFKKT
ncbi:DUF2752 domain-containing protein [Mucilaginibacter rivuli]|uniref:DUF2752 domain-containing protein n=1 Tax=Mucilaginibacter rivuli TaxID=2857527 RepID=UPI0021065534|nr:DUF2752 domain-containing protein [Mucilaginibacter rivuli]